MPKKKPGSGRAELAPLTDCNYKCNGDNLGICGGTNRAAMYDTARVELPCINSKVPFFVYIHV